MLVSSLLVSATIMSAVRAPAVSSVRGLARIALDGADVDAILQVSQQALIDVDDGDVVGLFAGQVVRRGPANLAGPEDDYFQVFEPVGQRAILAPPGDGQTTSRWA